MKIALFGTSADTAQSLCGGDYIGIRKLRLKSAKSGGQAVSGRLSGDEELIFKLNPANSGNGNLVTLLR